MYDQRHLRPKKVSWLYAAMFGPFGFITLATQYMRVWMLIKAKRYKLQLGNAEVPRRWLQKSVATSTTHLKATGTNEIAPRTAATIKPAITCDDSEECLSSATDQTPQRKVDGIIQTYAGECSVLTVLHHSKYLILNSYAIFMRPAIQYTQHNTRMSVFGR